MKQSFILMLIMAVLGLAICFAMANMPQLNPFADCADGVYIGEAEGYRKHLKAQVTISNGYITDIQIIEHYEKGAEHFKQPMEQIPLDIIAAQSVYVEAVAGATRTSKGIMDAVNAAIMQAEKH